MQDIPDLIPATPFGRFRLGRWRFWRQSQSASLCTLGEKSAAGHDGFHRWRHVVASSAKAGGAANSATAGSPVACVGVTLIIALVIALIVPRVSELTSGLPGIAASLKEKLHVFDGVIGCWRHFTSTVSGEPEGSAVTFPSPAISWVPSTVFMLLPPITGFLFFLVVLLLFIAGWPDLRRGLVMTFASRDLRLTVLKILNEIETGLANYLLIVALINVSVGAITGVICALTGLPNAIGFGALAATLNFIPIIGPTAMFAVLVLVGVVTEPTFASGLLPAAGFPLLIIVEGQFVTPTIIGRHLELNALAVLLSLAFWAWLWGPMGAFLSSPLLMVALILKQRLYGDDDP